MLKKIKELIELAKLNQKERLNLEQFDDPIAMETDWSPAQRGGSNFKTHKLVQESEDFISFRATTGMLIFSGIFFTVGMGMLAAAGFFDLYLGKIDLEEGKYILLGIGLIFAAVGGGMYYYSTMPIVFDKGSNTFWKGRKDPKSDMLNPKVKHLVDFQDIHAIQLLAERVSSKNGSYRSYEINLVLKDATRINVIDHGNRSSIVKDADILANFLNVPLWSTIS